MLKTLLSPRAWIFLSLFVALVVSIVSGSSSFQDCKQKHQAEQSGHAPNKGIAQIANAIRINRDCLGNFIHDNGEAITAMFTVVLALSTIFLWIATRDAVVGAEGNARRQLRAYIGATPTRIIRNKAGQFAVEIVTRNYGQTPARALQINGGRKLLPLTTDQDISANAFAFERTAESTGMDLHPGATTQVALPGFRNEEIELMSDGSETLRIHVAGIVTYEDVFGNLCETRFYTLINPQEFLAMADSPAGQITFDWGPARFNRGT